MTTVSVKQMSQSTLQLVTATTVPADAAVRNLEVLWGDVIIGTPKMVHLGMNRAASRSQRMSLSSF